jgi:hypothetical protein
VPSKNVGRVLPHLNLPQTNPPFPTRSRYRLALCRQNVYPPQNHNIGIHITSQVAHHSEGRTYIHKVFIMAPNWDRLIRFVATDGRELRGEPVLPSPDFDVGTTTEETELKAKVIQVVNSDIFDPSTKVTDEEVTVKKLLGPVTTHEVPIIRCIGLNFIKHSTYLQPYAFRENPN